MRTHLAEALCTFGLAIELADAVMLDALGHLSGAPFDPAVFVAYALGGHVPWSRALGYSRVLARR